MEAVSSITLAAPGIPLVLRDLSQYATLPFLAAFDVPDASTSSGLLSITSSRATKRATSPSVTRKRITYITCPRSVCLHLSSSFCASRTNPRYMLTERRSRFLLAYSIPIKMKYDCLAPSRFGKDQPLWKTATTSSLRIVREIAPQIRSLESSTYLVRVLAQFVLYANVEGTAHIDISDERVEGIWRQTIDVFRGGILADWFVPPSQSSLLYTLNYHTVLQHNRSRSMNRKQRRTSTSPSSLLWRSTSPRRPTRTRLSTSSATCRRCSNRAVNYGTTKMTRIRC